MSQNSNSTQKPGALNSKVLITSAVVIVVAVVLVLMMSPSDQTETSTEYFEAKRGEFLISITEGGSLQAVKETTIRNEVEGTARVIYIVPEGTFVRRGDVLVELDSGDAEDQRNQQEINVREAELALINAQEQINIGQSQTNSDITAAEITLELARIDLQKFQEGELAQNRRQLELDVETADADRVLAEQTFLNSSNLYANNFETKRTVDSDRIQWQKAEKSYINATNALWMFNEFDQRKQLREYESAVEEAIENLKRVIFQSQAEMAKYEADRLTKEQTLKLQKEKLERDIRNLEACVITAPTDGLIVYPEQRGRSTSESMIEEGATVRYRQDLVKLPDTSKMKLTVKVHESHVSSVREGQPAFVVLDPMPTKQFRGTVSKVGVMPNTADRWSNPDLKVYDTEIVLNEDLPESVKPGVSARAEIVVARLTDVITVPVQAVTRLKGSPVVYLAGSPPQPVEVEVGRDNTKMIHIVSGVNEGDRILLSPPLDTSESSIDGSIIDESMELELQNADGVARTLDEIPADRPRPPAGSRPEGGFPGGGMRGGGGPDMEEMMQRWDTNGDGVTDEAEMEAGRAAMRSQFGGGGQRGPGGGSGFRDQ